MTKAFILALRKQRSGVIVNLSSISGDQGSPYTAVYAALKAAVAAFTESPNIELADFGVSAKAIFPGAHATRIFTKIDVAGNVPDDYQPGMQRFLGSQGTGSSPKVTVDAIWMAVNDGDQGRVAITRDPMARLSHGRNRCLGATGTGASSVPPSWAALALCGNLWCTRATKRSSSSCKEASTWS